MLRRAARHGRLLGIRGCFLDTLCDTVVEENRGAYPALAERIEYIRKTIRTEEERFGQTIDAGLGILEKMMEQVSGGRLDGASIFRLYDTFGFPLDLTKEITACLLYTSIRLLRCGGRYCGMAGAICSEGIFQCFRCFRALYLLRSKT